VPPEKMIYYTPIPKSGGMSVFELFKANRDRQRIIGHGLMRDFFYAIDLLQNRQVDCIFDHYWFGLHELIQAPGRQAVYVTMLREPLERELSHLYFRRGIGGECENFASVEDWMTSPSCKRNRQSRFLCAYHDSPDAMRAFENLSEKYIAFGVAEYPHESIYMICKALGFKNIFVPWENVSKRSKERDERNEERSQLYDARTRMTSSCIRERRVSSCSGWLLLMSVTESLSKN
jgi:hypothetical protein